MHGGRESYSVVVPAKQPNKGGPPPAEGVEGRTLTKENMEQSNPRRTPSRESGQSGLNRVRRAAKGDGTLRFTALLHHVTVDLLRSSYHKLKKGACGSSECDCALMNEHREKPLDLASASGLPSVTGATA